MEVNQGYPGDKLSGTRQKYLDRAKELREKRENTIKGGYCILGFLIIVCIVVGLLAAYFVTHYHIVF